MWQPVNNKYGVGKCFVTVMLNVCKYDKTMHMLLNIIKT